MSIAVGDQVNARIVSDEVSGGAIVVWQDFRNGTDYDLYATRVNALGFPFWTPDGSPVCTETGYQTNPTRSVMVLAEHLWSGKTGEPTPSMFTYSTLTDSEIDCGVLAAFRFAPSRIIRPTLASLVTAPVV
jgi:hypothetical protein